MVDDDSGEYEQFQAPLGDCFQKIVYAFWERGWTETELSLKETVSNYFLLELLPDSPGKLAVSRTRTFLGGIEKKKAFWGGKENDFVEREIAKFEKELAFAK